MVLCAPRTDTCRSPVAQGVFEDVVRREGLQGQITVDSAGTHGFYNAGEPPDPRAQESVLARGIDISGQRARLLDPEDCQRFDYILTMDEFNYRIAAGLCGGGAEIRPFLDYAPGPETEVPDPYSGGPEGFKHVLGLIEEASEGLLREIRDRHPGD
ncbi:MAG: low molecular weight phosphotyrosine protein phosphatase [Rubrobacteraceae bacterium]|nr:low molecular weight phosphotyrosine protein phosphatase [Rubrobacteraceae bacterium]